MALSVKLEVPSNPRLLSVVRSTVQQFASVVGFSEADCRSVVLAVDEALANVIRHAYEGQPDQGIEVSCNLLCSSAGGDPDGLEFILVDHGKPGEPEKMKSRELDDIRPGGLGMHIITSIMDEVQYESLPGCNRLRLVKSLRK
jgi:anti-sigma regulatory factor (Ser/Thr protein kinase)